MLVRGAEPMEKRRARRGLFSSLWFVSPQARVGRFCDRTARRSRTTELSESVSEEAEYPP